MIAGRMTLLTLLSCALLSVDAASQNAAREMAASYLRMEVADRVVAEADKLVKDDASSREEVMEAAKVFRGNVISNIRKSLVSLFPDEKAAEKNFIGFVNRFNGVATSNDAKALSDLSAELGIAPVPENAAQLRAAIVKRDLGSDIDVAGKFMGDVQSWLKLKAKGEVPPLKAWLNRGKPAAAPEPQAQAKPKKKRTGNSLRDAEADAGKFVEAKDDGGSSLRSFGAQRKARRQAVMAEAQKGMEQVAAERRVADEEANAKKLAAAQADAAAMQAQAQRLADAEQQAVVQDQNSWTTRLKGVVSAAIGAAGGAFAGSIGNRVGEAAANAVFNPGR